MIPPLERRGVGRIGLTPEQFDTAFPFHFAVDRDLAILQAGPSLRRVCPDVAHGLPLPELFGLERPVLGLEFASLAAATKALLLWRHWASGLLLRGQLIPIRGGDALAFLGSPWLSDNSELAYFGLTLNDFALHDPIVDLLQMVQAHKIAFQDLRGVTTKLQSQRAELRQANENLNQQVALLAQAQAQLEQKEAETRKLALVASLTDNSVVLTDAEGRVEWVNEGFVRTTGYTLNEILGKKPGAVLQGENTDPATVAYMREQLRQQQGYTAQLINYHKSGREYWAHIEVRPIRDEHGDVTNYMAIERDITHRKRNDEMLMEAKREAEAASRAKSEFLAAMSHEIRSPMNAVLGTLELLRSSPLIDEQEIWVKAAHESANALLKIIDDILDFSKIEAGKLELRETGFCLESLLQDIVQLFRPRAAAKELDLSCSLAPGTPAKLKGDPFRLRQIVVNLIGNAVKFTDEGRVELAVAALDQDADSTLLEFHVRDTGIGISREAAASLFQEFVQLESASSRHYGGTGLGLVICKRLVDLMGGDIGVDSTPGRGSDFWFRVRLAIDPAPTALADEFQFPPAPGGGKLGRVLLAEDGEVNRLVITTMLEKAGYEVAAVHDGRAAVEAVGKGAFDVILMDVQMPIMDGLEAARAIRALPGPGARTPIVALTANALVDNRDACLAAGMDEFLTKPVNRARLIQGVAERLRGRNPPEPAPPSPPGAAPSAAPLLDPKTLRELTDNTDEMIMRLTVETFFEECEARVPRLAAAATTGDLGPMRTESHTLKSGAQLIGARRLGERMARIEAASRAGEVATAVALAGDLAAMVEATRDAYRERGAL